MATPRQSDFPTDWPPGSTSWDHTEVPLRAAAEHRSAISPTSAPSKPDDDGAPRHPSSGGTVIGFLVAELCGAGSLWRRLALAVAGDHGAKRGQLPRAERQLGSEDAWFRPGDRERRVRMVLGTAVAVAALCALVAVAYQGLVLVNWRIWHRSGQHRSRGGGITASDAFNPPRGPLFHGGKARLEIVPGATHLFEEPGALERVALLARDWFLRHLTG
jgi:hypothetical protein